MTTDGLDPHFAAMWDRVIAAHSTMMMNRLARIYQTSYRGEAYLRIVERTADGRVHVTWA